MKEQNQISEAAKEAAAKIRDLEVGDIQDTKDVEFIIQSALDAAARVEPTKKWTVEDNPYVLNYGTGRVAMANPQIAATLANAHNSSLGATQTARGLRSEQTGEAQ